MGTGAVTSGSPLAAPDLSIRTLCRDTDKETYLDPEKLAAVIKNLPLDITDLRPIDEAISTQGGVSFEALNEDLSIKNFPNIHCIGEMLDWHAPTGGYLLQGCFASGFFVAKEISFNGR